MKQGFTLTELLIALAILGVIATFTIPKVLQSQADGKYKAIAKESFHMVSGAFEAYKLNNTLSAATRPSHLTPYMNYVARDTVIILDQVYNVASTMDCSNSVFTCIRLHNGAVLWMMNNAANSFGGTASTNAVLFKLDPDGKVTDGSATGAGRALAFYLYYNGRITDGGNIDPSTNNGADTPIPNQVPPWFSWD